MPGRNIVKSYQEESFYHVYNRGVNKQTIFVDEQDYAVFLNLLKRSLGSKPQRDRLGREYKWYGDQLDLLAFCLMPNHFHLLWYRHGSDAITLAMKSIATAYAMYFNKRYKRVGPLFQQRFRAVPILDDVYLQHSSRYIHLNPKQYQTWQWSSLPYYKADYTADWVKPQRILELFDSQKQYIAFVADHEGCQNSLELLKKQLGY